MAPAANATRAARLVVPATREDRQPIEECPFLGMQVLTHSSQHRAQVLSWLSAQGVPTPDLDYVLMLGEQRGGS